MLNFARSRIQLTAWMCSDCLISYLNNLMSAINLIDCYQQVHNSTLNPNFYTNGYCTGNLLILVLSAFSLVACTLLMFWHFGKHGFKFSTFRKEATWILISLVIFEFILFCRYLFNLYNQPIYPFIIIFGSLLESITIYLVLSVFAKKASSKVDEMAWLSGFLLTLLIVILVLYGGVTIWSLIIVNHEVSCRSAVFIVSAVLNLLVSLFFCAIGYKIAKNGRIAIEQQKL